MAVQMSKSLQMTKSQISAYLAAMFATVSGLPGLMFFPRVRALITTLTTAVQAEEAVIFAALPETFTVANLVDTLFAWAKTKYPAVLSLLEILQFVLDGMLVAVPSL